MNTSNKILTLGIALALSACATVPRGPSVMVLPGSGKTFQQFQQDAAVCHQFALGSTGVSPAQAAQDSQARSAAAGAVVGTVAGAMIGAAAGNAGTGAAIGAGSGLLLGAASGQETGYSSMNSAQDRYDIAYIQCMYANGNQVPVPASARNAMTTQQYPPPPPNVAPMQPGGPIPPPPAGSPPPPPPGAVQPYSGPAPTR